MRAWLLSVAALIELTRAFALAELAAESSMRRGAEHYRMGAFEEAARAWKEAAGLFAAAAEPERQAQALLNYAQASHALGQQRLAVEAIEEARSLAATPQQKLQATAALGAALTFSRRAEEAEPLLRESLAMAREGGDRRATAAILNDLGVLLAARGRTAAALEACEEAERLAGSSPLGAKAVVNRAAATGDAAAARELNTRAIARIHKLGDSHEKAAMLLTAGRTWSQLQPQPGARAGALAAFREAHEVAARIGDARARSYALGYLGELYESDGRAAEALELTREAAFLAQQARAQDALFRWEWQKGRLFSRLGKKDSAIDAYRRAIAGIDPIRHDLAIGFGNANRRSSFREGVGPLFYELADLLLRRAESEADAAQAQRSLVEARDTLELLKAAELVDYFQDDCVNLLRAKSAPLETLAADAAVIYLIPLPDRTELLVGLPDGIHRFKIPVPERRLEETVRRFRRNLETRTSYEYLTEAWQLYGGLIEPIAPLLAAREIATLVFVPDGALRTIPLAALHDGREFLVRKYAVAVTPGLTLMDARPIGRERAHLLLSGLSEPVQGFSALGCVPGELDAIRDLYGGKVLADTRFRVEALGDQFRNHQYSIVHIASHARFEREARQSFLLTYDGRLTLDDLERFVRPGQFRGRPVELITLSACQTAAGDDRAALGLAGVAVKSGARSALATLWFVNDQSSSELVAEFYRQVRENPGRSKAEALRAAQGSLLDDRRYRHPCYWAPYLIIGNWL